MKAFKFSLQRILDVRILREEIKRKELAEAVSAELKECDTLHSLEDEGEIVKDRVRGRILSTLNPTEMMMYYNYAQQIDHTIGSQLRRIEEARTQVEEQRTLLLEAVKEKKAIEKLQERQWERYQSELNKEEQAFLDEIASTMPKRRKLMS